MARTDALLTTLQQKAAPENAALVVVDVQNDFAAEGGFFHRAGADVPAIQRTVMPRLLRFIDAARKASVLVVFVKAVYDPPYRSDPQRERDLRFKTPVPPCQSGTWGIEFCLVEPRPGEPIVVKHRYSGIMNTELDAVLKRHGTRSLLMTGVSTDTCVESTARDAYFINYYVTLVEDCCGAYDLDDHRSAVKRFARDYGVVVNSDDVIATWTEVVAPPARLASR
jgi:ureidoacrylate peracid hydrolase